MTTTNARGPIALNFDFTGPGSSTKPYYHHQSTGAAIKQIVTGWAAHFLKRNLILIVGLFLLAVWTWTTCAIAAHNARVDVITELTAKYDAEYAAKLEAYKNQQQAASLLTGEASLQAAISLEADEIARAIGPMKTRQMKLAMIWNILARVDNPLFPNSVHDVVAQPEQWMFYSPDNPIRDDDRELALEQLRLWHDGRYPAGFSSSFVYATWSDSDYVLRDQWEKSGTMNTWRYPE